MNLLFFPMLAGHLIADFWLQPNSWVLHKKANGIKSSKLLLHVAIASVLPVVFTFFLIYATGFILITSPLGIFTGKFLNVIITDKNKINKIDVSGWIGILERILILIFITTSQFSAIGFLIAAKSVFRFNDTREDGNKKAEYFLLGTLTSFTLAIIVGLGVNKLVLFVKTEL